MSVNVRKENPAEMNHYEIIYALVEGGHNREAVQAITDLGYDRLCHVPPERYGELLEIRDDLVLRAEEQAMPQESEPRQA